MRNNIAIVGILEWIALVAGACLIASVHGWQTGVGLALLVFVAMPVKQ